MSKLKIKYDDDSSKDCSIVVELNRFNAKNDIAESKLLSFTTAILESKHHSNCCKQRILKDKNKKLHQCF